MSNTIDFMQYPWLVWGFVALIIFMLVLDLWVFNKKSHEIWNKEALKFSIIWISLAMIFSWIIWYMFWIEKFSEFQSAYWIEKSLSVDNLFVFILVFWFFKIPKIYQHKILFYWIIWAIVFRAIFIFAWIELINRTYITTNFFWLLSSPLELNFVLMIFWLFLVYAWIKSWKWEEDEEIKDLSESFAYRIVTRFFKTTHNLDWSKFFTIENWKKLATPLFITLVVIEITDLVFAVDSIPAIFAIAPNDPFILYSSNIFAILGLRSLYFLLANFIDRFKYLSYGIAIILTFIGTKMLISPLFHIPAKISLIVLLSVLVLSVIVSLCMTPVHHQEKLTESRENN